MGFPTGPFGGGDWQTPRARRRPFTDQSPNVALTASLFTPADGAYAITIAGVDRTHYVDKYGVEITDDLNEAPNTCTFECFGFTPVGESPVLITTGTLKEFKGRIKTVTEHHDKLNDRTVYSVTCIDRTFELDQLVTEAYGSQSASTTASALVTKYGAGFTQSRIVSGLPTVAAIQFKMTRLSDALRQLADAFGGDSYLDYDDDVHMFVTETDVAPTAISTANTNWRSFKYRQATDGIKNRIFVEGSGSTVPADVAVAETIVPVTTISPFDVGAGKAVIGNQIITYTGRTEVTPGTAPVVAASTGTGLTDGAYSYAFTYLTAAGESLPSPLATMTAGLRAAPGAVTSVTDGGNTGSSLIAAGTYQYALTAVYPGLGETTPGPLTAITILANHDIRIDVPALPVGATELKLYRTTNGGGIGTLRKVFDIFSAPVVGTDRNTDADIAANQAAPTVNTAQLNQGALSAVLVGPSGTTSRKVYRTVSGGSQLKLQSTIPNNTATTLTDSTADGSLGANVPTSDTSGLAVIGFSTTSGATSAGATSITLVSATAFVSTGGWARVGTVTLRYTGTTATQLTGIPASGTGSISVAIPSGSLVQGLVALTGVPSSGTGSVVTAISTGAEINLLVQRDDTTSQATYGIRHMSVQDRRLSVAGAQARGDAELTLRKDPFITGSYITTDRNVRSGRRATISMGSDWGVSGTFTITRVRTFWERERTAPQREVTFSSRTTDKDLYRVLRELRRETQNAA